MATVIELTEAGNNSETCQIVPLGDLEEAIHREEQVPGTGRWWEQCWLLKSSSLFQCVAEVKLIWGWLPGIEGRELPPLMTTCFRPLCKSGKEFGEQWLRLQGQTAVLPKSCPVKNRWPILGKLFLIGAYLWRKPWKALSTGTALRPGREAPDRLSVLEALCCQGWTQHQLVQRFAPILQSRLIITAYKS